MSNELKIAINTLKKAMIKDSDYARCWHDSIAVMAQHAGAGHRISNDGASRFMKLVFGIDTSETT